MDNVLSRKLIAKGGSDKGRTQGKGKESASHSTLHWQSGEDKSKKINVQAVNLRALCWPLLCYGFTCSTSTVRHRHRVQDASRSYDVRATFK